LHQDKKIRQGALNGHPALRREKMPEQEALAEIPCYIPKTALNQFLIRPTGPPLPTIALTKQATAHNPTRPEATPMVIMLPRETVSIAAFVESLVLLWDLVMVLIVFLLL